MLGLQLLILGEDPGQPITGSYLDFCAVSADEISILTFVPHLILGFPWEASVSL